MDHLFEVISKWPPLKLGNHVLCHNLSSKAVRVTILMSIDMFLGARNSIMPIKDIFVLWEINKQQVKRISRAFSVIFVCYSMGQIGLMCTLHSETKFFLLIRPPPISKVDAI